jgi:hypothetical protein
MNRETKRIRKILTAVFFITIISVSMACEEFKAPQPSVDPLATWSLQTDIQPIFSNNCVSCHGTSRSPDLREGKSYNALTNGGYVTLPAEKSRLFSTMEGIDHISRSTETDRLKVLYWITQGAKNN